MTIRSNLSFAFACLCTMLAAGTAQAQTAPAYIPIQGTLAADDGTPKDGSFAFELRLYDLATGGTAFYAESQQVTIEDGLFTVYLGDGSPADLGDGTVSPALDLNVFSSRPQGVVFLGISVGSDPELSPRAQLGSVPFAGFAQTCADSTTVGGRTPASFASANHSHTAAQVGAAPANHSHTAAEVGAIPAGSKLSSSQVPNLDQLNGTLKASQLPDLSGQYATKNHVHPRTKYIFDSTSGSVQVKTGVHEFCALSKTFYTVAGSGQRWCEVLPNSDGTWTLEAYAPTGGGQETKCNAFCM